MEWVVAAVFLIGGLILGRILKPFWNKILPTDTPESYEEMMWKYAASLKGMRQGQLVVTREDTSRVYNLTDIRVMNNYVQLWYDREAMLKNGHVADAQRAQAQFGLHAPSIRITSVNKSGIIFSAPALGNDAKILPQGHPDIAEILT